MRQLLALGLSAAMVAGTAAPTIAADPTLPPPLPRVRQVAPVLTPPPQATAPAAPQLAAPALAPSIAPSIVPPAPPAAAGAPAPASGPAPPVQTAALPTFDDWRQGCERRQAQDKPVCFIEQRLSHAETPDRLAVALAIGYFGPGSKLAMIVKLPPTTILEAGMIVQVDDRDVREVGIRACGPANCTVAALVDDKLLGELRAGKRATVAYQLKESQEIVRVPLSLKGFSRGIASLRPGR